MIQQPSAPVSVGTRYTDWLFVLPLVLAVGGGLAGGAVLLAGGDSFWAWAFAVVAAAAGVFAVGQWWRIARGRRWLRATDTGFELTDRRGPVELPDDAITDLATWQTVRYSNGRPAANRRTGTLVLAAGEAVTTLPVEYEYALNWPDPLGPFLGRVFARLVDQAEAAVRAGGELAGDGWALTADRLSYRRGRVESEVKLADVVAADVADGHVCVWVRGADAAAVRVPAGSANALVLCDVLPRLRPADAPEPAADDGLGRELFRRDNSCRGGKMVVFTVLCLAGVGGGVALVALADGRDPTVARVFGVVLGLAAVGGWVYAWRRRVNVFRCHERGVVSERPGTVRTLRFRDCGSFRYSATRHYHNGAYTGTALSLTFTPLDPAAGDAIAYSATVQNADQGLDDLRDHVSRVVAGHLLGRLAAGQPVVWTPNLTLQPDGLEVRAGGWFGGGGTRLVPYADLGRYQFHEGQLRIADRATGRWLVKQPVTAANFFPGFLVLQHILTPPEADAPPA